jgi:protein-export membrane protein SecD
MIAVYGGLGIAASVALMIYVILYVCVLAVFPWVQLTFPGIAGIILSIGMAVDANVLIFDRIKEEYLNGKTVEASIKSGFKRAVVTVLDSNITTVLAAIVLWVLCSGSIKGFAITLFLGVLVSMFSAIVITRWLIKVIRPFAKDEERFLRLRRRDA